MKDLQKQIKLIKKHYNPEELKNIFVKRLDEEMFETLGRMAQPVKDTDLVWFGYELAIGSRYLGE